MENESAPLVDEYLLSCQGMQEAGTDNYFYTRLKARMQRKNEQGGWGFSLKPVWAIASLVLLLGVNSVMLMQKTTERKQSAQPASLQSFAEAYDQTISSL